MVSGHYPDGVTGREREIAGPWREGVEALNCPNAGAIYVPAHVVTAAIQHFTHELKRLQTGQPRDVDWAALENYQKRLIAAARDLDCEWEGETEVEYTRAGMRLWTCPQCGFEHEDDLSDEIAERNNPRDY